MTRKKTHTFHDNRNTNVNVITQRMKERKKTLRNIDKKKKKSRVIVIC